MIRRDAMRRCASATAFGLWMAAAAPHATAQQFHLYLLCNGSIKTPSGKVEPAHIDLALRDNNMTALIQRSNLLPVGERMKYNASQTHYTMTYATPRQGTAIYSHWLGTILIMTYPEFRRTVETRLSIDRQSAVLEGEMMALNNEQVGTLRMSCEPRKHDQGPAPKF